MRKSKVKNLHVMLKMEMQDIKGKQRRGETVNKWYTVYCEICAIEPDAPPRLNNFFLKNVFTGRIFCVEFALKSRRFAINRQASGDMKV